jgi:hypothetical protein
MCMYKKLNLLCLMILAGNGASLFSMDQRPWGNSFNFAWEDFKTEDEILHAYLSSLDLEDIARCATKNAVNVSTESTLNYLFLPYRNAKEQVGVNSVAGRPIVEKSAKALAMVLPLCDIKHFKFDHLLKIIEITANHKDAQASVANVLENILRAKPSFISRVEYSNRSGMSTPLSVAVSYGNCTAAKCLLDLGADAHLNLSQGHFAPGCMTSAYQLAYKLDNQEMKDIFAASDNQ